MNMITGGGGGPGQPNLAPGGGGLAMNPFGGVGMNNLSGLIGNLN